jgi:EAL domain-containing protein (putative c-di-GMP-specific phosphodiesterase class I)
MQAELESRVGRQVLARQAWEARDFRIHYQPITNTRERRLTGAEALLRWTTEELGAVPPQEFVATLEDMGLIAEVGDWVIKQACEQAREWTAAGLPSFVMSVNVSPRHFQAGEALVASVRTALAASGLEAGRLQLEITESAMMEHRDEALLTINQLKALGVGIAVDDFGTGYSSLSYLKYFPVDALKIDRVFVSELSEEAAESNIVLAIVQLAKGLKLSVIAEGVETQRQLDLLQVYGCDVVQGYMLGQPTAPREFEDRFLRSTLWLEDTAQIPVARARAEWDDRTIPVR